MENIRRERSFSSVTSAVIFIITDSSSTRLRLKETNPTVIVVFVALVSIVELVLILVPPVSYTTVEHE